MMPIPRANNDVKPLHHNHAARGINIQLITTSEIKISILIDAAYTELAVRTLHSIYDLDAA